MDRGAWRATVHGISKSRGANSFIIKVTHNYCVLHFGNDYFRFGEGRINSLLLESPVN